MGMNVFGSTFCAAPIVSSESAEKALDTKGTATFVQFWAVGKDCCPNRGGFACGGAKSDKEKVRSGVVLPEVRNEELSAFAHATKLEQSGFLMAVQAACALYELETGEAPVLLHWVKSPDREILGWLTTTLLIWILSSVGWGLTVSVVWFLVDYYFDADMRIEVEEGFTGRPHHEHHQHHHRHHHHREGGGAGSPGNAPLSARLGPTSGTSKKETTGAFSRLLAAMPAGNPFKTHQEPPPELPGPWGPKGKVDPPAAAIDQTRAGSPGTGAVPHRGVRPSHKPGIRASSRGPPIRGSRSASPAPGARRR